MTMKRASSVDIGKLVALMEQFYADSGHALDRNRAADSLKALIADESLGHLWIIEVETQVVGYVVVTFVFRMEYGGLCAVVDDLYIAPEYRGEGLGTESVHEIVDLCTRRGILALQVETGRDNEAARAAYRKSGFTEVDRILMIHQLLTR